MARRIDRSTFHAELTGGVSLDSPPLARSPALRRLDGNRDGRLTGPELTRAFNWVDRHDRDGSGHTFREEGAAARAYGALRAARLSPEAWGEAVARAAVERVRTHGADYALMAAPTSPHPGLSGNRVPEQTRLTWLAGYYKCNQFVGDVLTQAGMAFPTHRMPDGSLHYVAAEQVLRFPEHFTRVPSLSQARPGDVLVRDYARRGEEGAHLEVLTRVPQDGSAFTSAGAHEEGAWEGDTYGRLLARAAFDARRGCWVVEGDCYSLLRPKKPL
jgi:hypothetical protein